MKTFTAILLSLALLLSLAACGSLPPGEEASPTPEATAEPSPEATATPEPTLPPEDTEAGKIALEFADVYFHGGAEDIEPWLVDDYQWGVDTYDSEAPTDILLQYVFPSEDEENLWSASIRFRMGNEDSFTYLVLDLVQGDEGWKVSFYGLDK